MGLRDMMVYLGLADDEEYEAAAAPERETQRTTPAVRVVDGEGDKAHGSHSAQAVAAERERTVAPLRPAPAEREERTERSERRGEVAQFPQRGAVARAVKDQEVGPLNRITTIHPRTYNEAKVIGESFREGIPVIMNLGDMADDDAKRLVDFAAGLVFGLAGTIERVTNKVFLLSPAHVEVESEQGTSEPGKNLFNQS